MTTLHVCLSGSLACSGCNPCPPCLRLQMQLVLPIAMRAAGFNGDARQAEAFFAGVEEGWRRMHGAMEADPRLRASLRITDVTALDGASMPAAPPQPPLMPPQFDPRMVDPRFMQQPPPFDPRMVDPRSMQQPPPFDPRMVDPRFMQQPPPFDPRLDLQVYQSTAMQAAAEAEARAAQAAQRAPAFDPNDPNLHAVPPAPRPQAPSVDETRAARQEQQQAHERDRVRNLTTEVPSVPSGAPMSVDEVALAGAPVALGSVMMPGFVPASQRSTDPNMETRERKEGEKPPNGAA